MSKFVSKNQSCLTPKRGFNVLMVKLNTPERIVSQSSEQGIKLCASFVHCGSGEEAQQHTYNLRGPITLYFMASDKQVLSDWHYILQYVPRLGRYCCSCVEGRDYGTCRHSAELEEMATTSPEKIVAVA